MNYDTIYKQFNCIGETLSLFELFHLDSKQVTKYFMYIL